MMLLTLTFALWATPVGCGDDTSATDDTATGSDADADTDSDADSDADTDTDTTPQDPCEDVDCSGQGDCVVDGDKASCDCDEGYLADGLSCESCPIVDPSAYDMTVQTLTLSGDLTIEGGLPLDGDNYGAIWLTTEDGDTAELGLTYYESYETLLVAGTYDLYYQTVQANGSAPENRWALVESCV